MCKTTNEIVATIIQEDESMKNISLILFNLFNLILSLSMAISNLMYTQVCSHFNIAFVVSNLGRYLNNPILVNEKS
ncbi:hypothetical protein CR513_53931, partial [Mucuna pruriens]